MPVNILKNNSGSINDHPDCQGKPHHCHIVDGYTAETKNDETAEKTGWNCNDSNKGGSHCSEEKKHDQGTEYNTNNDVYTYTLHGSLYEGGGIGEDLHIQTAGKFLSKFLYCFDKFSPKLYLIDSSLFPDLEDYYRLAVKCRYGSLIFIAIFYRTHI